MSGERIADEEIVFRRIPPIAPFFEEPDRISSVNFSLDKRQQERGLSVYRASLVTAAQVLTKPGAIAGSKIVQAKAADIRSLTGGDGKLLNLDVVAVDDENDAGHAEIRGPEPGKLSKSASKALRSLFRPV